MDWSILSFAAFDGARVLDHAGKRKSRLPLESGEPGAHRIPLDPDRRGLGACSDGLNSWITLLPDQIARF